MKTYNINRLRFLIVDPNKHMHTIFREVLRALGAYELMFAKSVAEALFLLKEFRPDMIITDLAMEPQDGIEFTKILRSSTKGLSPFIPIIMATGYTEAGRVVAARDAGVTEIVAKPMSAASLYSRIYAIIDAPREFVRTADFFGPDRRRRQIEQDMNRRKTDRTEAADAKSKIYGPPLSAVDETENFAAKSKVNRNENAKTAASSQSEVIAMLDWNDQANGGSKADHKPPI